RSAVAIRPGAPSGTRRITERDPFEADLFAEPRQLTRAFDETCRLVEDLEEPLRAGEALRHPLPGTAEILERLVEEHDRGEERDHPLRLETAQLHGLGSE